MLHLELIKASCSQISGHLKQTFTLDKLQRIDKILRPLIRLYVRSKCSKRNDTSRFADKKLIRLSTLKHKKNHQTRESEPERKTDEAEKQQFVSKSVREKAQVEQLILRGRKL